MGEDLMAGDHQDEARCAHQQGRHSGERSIDRATRTSGRSQAAADARTGRENHTRYGVRERRREGPDDEPRDRLLLHPTKAEIEARKAEQEFAKTGCPGSVETPSRAQTGDLLGRRGLPERERCRIDERIDDAKDDHNHKDDGDERAEQPSKRRRTGHRASIARIERLSPVLTSRQAIARLDPVLRTVVAANARIEQESLDLEVRAAKEHVGRDVLDDARHISAPQASEGDVGRKLSSIRREPQRIEGPVNAPPELAERRVVGDARPERTRLPPRRKKTDALKRQAKRRHLHNSKRLDDRPLQTAVDIAQKAQRQMKSIGTLPASSGQADAKQLQMLVDRLGQIDTDKETWHMS